MLLDTLREGVLRFAGPVMLSSAAGPHPGVVSPAGEAPSLHSDRKGSEGLPIRGGGGGNSVTSKGAGRALSALREHHTHGETVAGSGI